MGVSTKTASGGEPRTHGHPRTAHAATAGRAPLPGAVEWFWRTFRPDAPSALPLPGGSPAVAEVERMLDSIAQVQAETARFAACRVHRALEAQAEMLRCRSGADLRAAQETYVQGLADDYAHEWARLAGYGMRLGLGLPVPPPPEPEDERHATPV